VLSLEVYPEGGKDPGKIHTDRQINVELLAMNAESAV